MAVEGKERMRAGGGRIGPDFGDAIAVDDQGAGRQDPVGQHQRRAGQDDHRRALIRGPSRS